MNLGTGLLIKPGMFLSSYSPLFGMLAIRFDSVGLRWTCGALAAIGIAILLIYVLAVPTLVASSHYQIDRVTPAGAEATGYLASYLLPFLTVAQPTGRDLWAYVMFLGVAGVVYTRTAIIQVNPVLLLLGWRVLRIENHRGLDAYLITRRSLAAGDTVCGARLASDVLVERES